MSRRMQLNHGIWCSMVLAMLSTIPIHSALADTSGPSIVHDLIRGEIPAGSDYRIIAKVTDDSPIDEVMLHFRVNQNSAFTTRLMRQVEQGEYIAILRGNEIFQPTVQYFITAIDSEQNDQSRGFPFDPLVINVGPPVVALAESGGAASSQNFGDDISTNSRWTDNKYLYIAGGVAVAVAVAVLSNQDDGEEELCTPCAFGIER